MDAVQNSWRQPGAAGPSGMFIIGTGEPSARTCSAYCPASARAFKLICRPVQRKVRRCRQWGRDVTL